jgi:hypothetical protein
MSFLCCSSERPALALSLALLEDRPEPPAPPEDLRFPATLVASTEDFFLLAIRSWTAGHCSVAYCITSATRAHRVPAGDGLHISRRSCCKPRQYFSILICSSVTCPVRSVRACWNSTLYSAMSLLQTVPLRCPRTSGPDPGVHNSPQASHGKTDEG